MNDEVRMQYELEALYSRYAEVLDDGPLSEWPLMFTEECMYKVMPRDNFDRDLPLAIIRCESRGMLEDRVVALRQTMMYEPRALRHLISGLQVSRLEDDALGARANYCVLETLVDEPTKILQAGRYQARLQSAGGGLRFCELSCVFDSVVVPNSLVVPV